MMFMNEYEIDAAFNAHRNKQRFDNEALALAVAFLSEFRNEVNAHSDGWAYWGAPVKAAKKLMTLVQNPSTVTHVELHKALTPIKSFYTRRGYAAGMKFPEVGLL